MSDLNREDPNRLRAMQEISELLKKLGLTRDQESGAQPTPKAGNSPSKDQKPGAANNAGAGADAGSGPADQFRKLLEQLQSLGPNGIKQVLQQNPQLATTLLRAT